MIPAVHEELDTMACNNGEANHNVVECQGGGAMTIKDKPLYACVHLITKHLCIILLQRHY